jgi:hypothetical protein
MKNYSMVKKVTETTMAGGTPLEKRLNAYLTCKFISDSYIPDDECLPEARYILTLKKKGLRGELHKYLEYQFGTAPAAVVKEIVGMLKTP